jgi:hypothetical protein
MSEEFIISSPQMDQIGLAHFYKTVGNSKCYLEYGCGGSTVWAANIAKVSTIVSVDTDLAYIEKVRSTIDINNKSRLLLEFCNFGEVGDWGLPKSTKNYADFYKYSTRPWEICKMNRLVPDTILIDGRFRVACFLYTLLTARVGTQIMFDDYFDRPGYFIVEQFCRLDERKGRMGIFYSSNNFNNADLVAAYAKYSLNWA